MYKILKHGISKMYITKKETNLYVKDKTGDSRLIEYGLYDSSSDPIGLRDYMNIRDIKIQDAVEELEECEAVLVGHHFGIAFYTEKDMNKFVEKIESLN